MKIVSWIKTAIFYKKNITPQLIVPFFNFEWEIFEKSKKKNSGKELYSPKSKEKKACQKSHMSNDVRDDKLRNSEGYK